MTKDTPDSAEMIRRAKESLKLETEDFMPAVGEDLADSGMAMSGLGLSIADETPAEAQTHQPPEQVEPNVETLESARDRRVISSNRDHLVHAPTRVWAPSMPVPPVQVSTGSLTSSGRWMRLAGTIILMFVVLNWVLLLIGLIDNPEDIADAVVGGAVASLVPLILGLILRRAGKRRGSLPDGFSGA